MIEIGDRKIEPSRRPYVIAEAGVHHYNSLELAKEYVLQASIAGADAIKFQTYDAKKLATKWAPTYWDSSVETQQEFFSERSRLAQEDYEELFAYARRVSITLLSTPFDAESVELLARLGMPAFKIASADITHHALIKKVANQGLPVLMSTGASRIDEIREAVRIVDKAGVPLALLHCNLAYPTPLSEANLLRIRHLISEFPDHVIGYSDHTRPQDSLLPCPSAVVLGARVIEKHFTLNKALAGDDHEHAVDPAGLQQLVKACSVAFEMTSQLAEITDSERAARERARRSIVAARALESGHRLESKDIAFKRPGTGLDPTRTSEVLGRSLTADVEEDELITPELLS